MSSVEEELRSLRSEVDKFKVSQYLGGSSYRVYETRISWSRNFSSDSMARWMVAFIGSSNFPLVNFGFEIMENGVLKPKTRPTFFNYGSEIGCDSILKYDYTSNWQAEASSYNLSGLDYDIYAPNVYSIVLSAGTIWDIGVTNPGASVNFTAKVKANCEGVLRVNLLEAVG